MHGGSGRNTSKVEGESTAVTDSSDAAARETVESAEIVRALLERGWWVGDAGLTTRGLVREAQVESRRLWARGKMRPGQVVAGDGPNTRILHRFAPREWHDVT
eukprot:7735923-Pyramimonas_sp.AAC.1